MNVAADGALRDLVTRWMAAAAVPPDIVAACTDDELWAVLLGHPSTAADARLLRRDPAAWQVVAAETAVSDGTAAAHDSIAVVVHRLYLDRPLVDGRPPPEPFPTFAALPATPVRFAVRRPAHSG